MDYDLLAKLVHIVGFILLGGGLFAVFVSEMRAYRTADVCRFAAAAATFYDALVVHFLDEPPPTSTLHAVPPFLRTAILAGRHQGVTPFGGDRFFDRAMGWPNIEVSETEKEVKVTAELPGLEEKDVEVELANGVLAIKGEKKTETEDKGRLFSERYYGRFERRIPIDDIEENKVAASFKNGVLTVTLPKSEKAQQKVKRIAISGK